MNPAENKVCEKCTPEILHDTSYLLKNSDTLSSTQEKLSIAVVQIKILLI